LEGHLFRDGFFGLFYRACPAGIEAELGIFGASSDLDVQERAYSAF
jgi:hypothetical protein